MTNQLRQTEEGESQNNIEKVIASKETHQLMKISLEFLPVEYNYREEVANQPKGCDQRLKRNILKIKKNKSSFYHENSFHNKAEHQCHY